MSSKSDKEDSLWFCGIDEAEINKRDDDFGIISMEDM